MRKFVTLGDRCPAVGRLPQGNEDYQAGQKANALQDYDTALVDYERALRTDPTNAEYKLRASQARYDAGQFHVQQGKKARRPGICNWRWENSRRLR